MLLQTSEDGVPGEQDCGTPPTHAVTVFWHAPTPQVTVPRLSSLVPSQSLSLRSQSSTAFGPAVHLYETPPSQFCAVRRHAPTPHVLAPRVSSVVPSQSSSMLLHVSALEGPGEQVCVTPLTQF